MSVFLLLLNLFWSWKKCLLASDKPQKQAIVQNWTFSLAGVFMTAKRESTRAKWANSFELAYQSQFFTLILNKFYIYHRIFLKLFVCAIQSLVKNVIISNFLFLSLISKIFNNFVTYVEHFQRNILLYLSIFCLLL